MSNNRNYKLILFLIICISFGLLTFSLNYPIMLKSGRSTNYDKILKDLNTSASFRNIYIDSNKMFTDNATSEGWNGNGTYNNPIIIENYEIDASTGNGIEIRNVDLYFTIRNVTISNGRSNYYHGFYFNNVTNGQLINNTVDNNLVGFLIIESSNNTFTGNNATNSLHGFRFWYSNNNSIIDNDATHNFEYGIFLDNSNNNTITQNFLVLNGLGSIYEKDSIENVFSDNIFGLTAFTLISDVLGFDEDGSFELNWTVSENADNYTLFKNGEILEEGIIDTNYTIHGLTVGTYVFYVKAISKYEELDSNEITIIVSNIIDIDGNTDFHQTAIALNFTGVGTYNNPYIIQNYEIVASGGHGIYIQNTDIYFIIRNVAVTNGRLYHYFGFNFINVTNAKLENNTANNNYYGFYFRNCYNNTLVGNFAINNINGIIINSSYGNTLVDNRVSMNRHGFSLDSSHNNTLVGNECVDNTYLGFFLSSSNNNTFLENIAKGNLNGFSFSFSNNNTIKNNTANINRQNGFHLSYSNFNILTNNIVKKNDKYGIYLEESYFNIISNNILEENGLGSIHIKNNGDNDFPDVFFIASIIFIIAVLSFITFKATFAIKKKKLKLSNIKLFLKKFFKRRNR